MELRGVFRAGARVLRQVVTIAALVAPTLAQPNQAVRTAVDAVSEQQVRQDLETLVGFGIRDAANPSSGIGASRDWIAAELRSYSPRLQVRISEWPNALQGVAVQNVIAELPGTRTPEIQILVTAHYDSIRGVGAADNASGTVAMLEVARVLSQFSFDKTLVFIGFSGEEHGLLGSERESVAAALRGARIEAVLNADIVGNDPAPPGVTPELDVYVGRNAASSERLGLYAKRQAEAYARVNIEVFAGERVGHASDHEPYRRSGYAGIRFLTPYESRQEHHSPKDSLDRASVPNTTLAARVIASVAGALALDNETTGLLPVPQTTVPTQ